MNSRFSGLIPPIGGNAGDGAVQPTSDVLRDEIDYPIRDKHAAMLRDAVTYLVDNALNGSEHNVKESLNIRHNATWDSCQKIIREAQPLADAEIARRRLERERIIQEQSDFRSLADLFASLGLRVKKTDDWFTVSDLTEEQARRIADILTESADNGTDTGTYGDKCQR